MGARQRAQKRGARSKGGEKRSPYSQKDSSSSLRVTSLDPSLRSAALQGWNKFAKSESVSASGSGYGTPQHNGFSMIQEARNTDRHGFGWGHGRLRDNKISFVSAGTLTREEMPGQEAESSSSSEELEEDNDDTPEDGPMDIGATHEEVQMTTEISEATKSMTIKEPLEPAEPSKQESNDLQSSSDEEEVVFAGRNAATLKRSEKHAANAYTSTLPGPVSQIAPEISQSSQPNTRLQPLEDSDVDLVPSPNILDPKSYSVWPQPRQNLATAAESSFRPRAMNHKYHKGWRARRQIKVSDEDAILQDYIANIAKDYEDEDGDETEEGGPNKPHRRIEHFRYYDGAAEKHVKVQTESSNNAARKHPQQAIDWNSDDLEDFDDLGTTDEDISNVGQVLRHRERSTGLQYLVTEIGKTTSDAKWILQSKLTSATAVDEIRIYEEIRTLKVDLQSESESVSSSADEALNDLNEDIESEMDENARIFEHTQRMTDEEVARILAKQEELGMGGDELILFDGQGEDDDESDDEDDFFAGESFIPFSLEKHTSNRGRSKRNQRKRNSFPSAAAFADALDQDPYGAFDVMDFDRPSLRPKNKSSKAFPWELELEDEELKQQIVSQWTKDREKKADRKREKMEARAAEMFEAGERSDPVVIKAEIRQFLTEETDTLKLAPMDAPLRASVHRLAKSLKLNSRSEGKDGVGAGRFPVLTKTPHTPYYTINTVWEVDALMNMRKFFPKHCGGSYKGPNATKVPKVKKGKGGAAAASYANGEVVGATAPELGVENRGRAMLEKMGWSMGMGIGKEGNEGGLEHIKHIVKTNKAGLG